MNIAKTFNAAAVSVMLACGLHAQQMQKDPKPAIAINHISAEIAVSDLSDQAWAKAASAAVTRYWSGEAAPKGRAFTARMLWSDTTLYVRFDAEQAEPLIVAQSPNTKMKTVGLWDRDVCEIFLAPDAKQPRKYYEFEVAPNGEWVDLFIDYTGKERQRHDEYVSGMKSFAKISEGKVTMVMAVDFKAFGRSPKAGDVWLGNLFRCVGKDPDRGYLAYNATETGIPSFHVPEKFVKFEFKS